MKDNKSIRTQTMEALGMPIEKMICYAASDYKCALANNLFAKEYGGIDSVRNELFSLVEKWEKELESLPIEIRAIALCSRGTKKQFEPVVII